MDALGVRESASSRQWQPLLLAAHPGLLTSPSSAGAHGAGAGASRAEAERAPAALELALGAAAKHGSGPEALPQPEPRSPARSLGGGWAGAAHADSRPRLPFPTDSGYALPGANACHDATAPDASARADWDADGDVGRSLDSSELLTALRSQLRDLDGVQARLQLQLSRALASDAEDGSAPSLQRAALPGPADDARAAPAQHDGAPPGSPARAVALELPQRDPDQQPPSVAPTPPSGARGAGEPRGGAGARARESPARLEQIKRILRVSRSGAGLWDDDSGDEQ